MNILIGTLALILAAAIFMWGYFMRQLWIGNAVHSRKIDEILAAMSAQYTHQYEGDQELHRSIGDAFTLCRQTHDSIEAAISRVRLEWGGALLKEREAFQKTVQDIRAEWSTAHQEVLGQVVHDRNDIRGAVKDFADVVASNNKKFADLIGSAESQIGADSRCIDHLGEQFQEFTESRKQTAIDMDMRFAEMEKTLKIKRVEVGDRNQGVRSKPWSEIRTSANQGAARARHEAETQSS